MISLVTSIHSGTVVMGLRWVLHLAYQTTCSNKEIIMDISLMDRRTPQLSEGTCLSRVHSPWIITKLLQTGSESITTLHLGTTSPCSSRTCTQTILPLVQALRMPTHCKSHLVHRSAQCQWREWGEVPSVLITRERETLEIAQETTTIMLMRYTRPIQTWLVNRMMTWTAQICRQVGTHQRLTMLKLFNHLKDFQLAKDFSMVSKSIAQGKTS